MATMLLNDSHLNLPAHVLMRSGQRRLWAQGTIHHWTQMGVDGEAGIDERNDSSDDVTDDGSLLLVPFRNPHGCCWNNLGPPQSHVGGEDSNGQEVECTPADRLEHLELKAVDITHL